MRKTWMAALAAAAACANAGGVKVKDYGVGAPSKPAGCALEILRKPPARPYDTLGEISSHLTSVPQERALSVVTPKACELGADAVIVVNNMVLNEMGHVLVAVTAIRWAAAPAAPPAEISPAPATTTVTPPPTPATQLPPGTPEVATPPAQAPAPTTSPEATSKP